VQFIPINDFNPFSVLAVEDTESEEQTVVSGQSESCTRNSRPCGKTRENFSDYQQTKGPIVFEVAPNMKRLLFKPLKRFTVHRKYKNVLIFELPRFMGEADDNSRPEDDFCIPRRVYDHFIADTRRGSLLTAVADFIEACDKVDTDVKVHDREWFRTHSCAPPPVMDPSPAFDLPDWDFAHKNGKPTPNFCTNLRQVVEGSVMALNLQENMPDVLLTVKAKKKIFKEVA